MSHFTTRTPQTSQPHVKVTADGSVSRRTGVFRYSGRYRVRLSNRVSAFLMSDTLDSLPSAESLRSARCEPCEGGIRPMSHDEAAKQRRAVAEWTLVSSGDRIERTLNTGDFVRGVELIDHICEIAESEQHHPDLHLTGYRHLKIVLTTHAIDGLSRNDFIVAAKIDQMLAEVDEETDA